MTSVELSGPLRSSDPPPRSSFYLCRYRVVCRKERVMITLKRKTKRRKKRKRRRKRAKGKATVG